MGHFLKNAPIPGRERLGLAALSLALGAFGAVYFRSMYLPILGLKALGGKLLVCGAATLLLGIPVHLSLEWLLSKFGKCPLPRLLLGAFTLVNHVCLFSGHEAVCPTLATKLLLTALALLGSYMLCWGIEHPAMEKYRGKGSCTAILFVSLYASLASFGQRYFLGGNSRIHFSMEGLVVCLSGVLWFFPVILLGLYLLEAASTRLENAPPPKGSRRTNGLILLGCLAAVQAVLLLIFWPGFFPDDAYNQLRMALGTAPLNDWHPVLVSLLQRLIMALTGNAAMIVAVQMALWCWLLWAYLMLGYDRGIPVWLLCLLGSVFLCLPNQALSWASAMKDYPYTLALLWGTYLILQLLLDSPWSRRLSFWLCMALDLFLIAGLRHNGMLPFIGIGLLCGYLTLRRFRQVKWRALSAFLAALLAVAVYKGPVYQRLDVIPNIQSPYTSMLCAVGSYINKGLPLSEESTAIMERVMPLEDWAEYYSRYEGHDVYYWGRPEGSVPYDTASIHAGDAFRVYLEALSKAPDVILKDRLDGMDILWDVAMPEDSFNANAFHYVFTYGTPLSCIPMEHMQTQDGQRYYKQTPAAQFYFSTTSLNTRSAADMLLWRAGPYLIALLALLIFWHRNRMNCMYMAAIPLLFNGAASVLILYHQSFRYIYFVQVITLALIYSSVLLRPQLSTPKSK